MLSAFSAFSRLDRILSFLISIILVALCDAALNPALFPPHQLRLDALRRFLSAYSARIRVHFGEEAREVADSSRLECTSFLSDFIRFPSRLRERRWRSCHVSYLRWDSIFQFSNMSQFLITYQFHFTLFRHPAGAGWTRVPSRMYLSLPSAYRCYLISSSSATLYELCCWSFVRQLRCRMRADLRVISYKPSGELKMMRVSATETKTEYLSSTKVNKCRDCHLFCCRMQSLLNVKSRLNFRVCKHSLQIHLFYILICQQSNAPSGAVAGSPIHPDTVSTGQEPSLRSSVRE